MRTKETLDSLITIIQIATVLAKTIDENRNLFSELKKLFLNKKTKVINEFDELYEAVEIYLSNRFEVRLEHNEKVRDYYDGHKFKWIWLQSEVKSFNLVYREDDYDYVLQTYLPHIRNEAI
ncbi:hypothetical protein EJD97_020427 [Solanum chilense]|uniref:AAA-type ATPase N-terminal domain-containing protein n=1 Tax=Solanum chilense TaxID=4083 RepID=A0A6N2CAS4_SOLCI|nr:hypothetical protein EJD97_020427 [Solanum chilense]